MKIPTKLSYQDFRNLSIYDKKKELLEFLTEKTLQIEINRNIEIGRVPKFSREIKSENICYLLIAKDIFEFRDTPTCTICRKEILKPRRWAPLLIKSTVCSKNCYIKYRKKQTSELNKKTGVSLEETQEILENWEIINPFRGVVPPEMIFNHEKESKDISFKWRIFIPDFLDVFYWPLQKKKMTELLLNYTKLNNKTNRPKEVS